MADAIRHRATSPEGGESSGAAPGGRPEAQRVGGRSAAERGVDSLLLDYLNKPTAPNMQAVTLSVREYAPTPASSSGVPTAPPIDRARPVPAIGPPPPAPGPDVTGYEDERPTGRCDATAPPNARDLVRDRGVLVRLDGDESGEVRSLPRDTLLVGRSTRAQLHITDLSVSRAHARIVFEYGSFFVEDLASQNGTLLAGRRVTRGELRDGDLVQFGQRATYRFALMDETQERVMRRLYDSSMRDPLTGADNRRCLDGRLHAEIAFAQRHRRPLSVILLDIDFFKNVNDRHGHPAGDEVLKAVAATVRGQLRTEDASARYGGEEFAIVLRDTAIAEAAHVAERVRERIARTSIDVGGATLAVTVSAGCSSLACCSGASSEELISVADRRLYRAKRNGRNRVVSRDDA